MTGAHDTKKRHAGVGTMIAAGVGIYIAAYLPSFMLFPKRLGPILSTAAALIVLMIVAIRFTSLRQGLIWGLILGLLAGGGSWSALDTHLNQMLAALSSMEIQPEPGTQPAAETQPATTSAPADEGPPTEAERQQAIQEIQGVRSKLPVMCFLPNALLGIVVGGIFAQAAAKRRERAESMWR